MPRIKLSKQMDARFDEAIRRLEDEVSAGEERMKRTVREVLRAASADRTQERMGVATEKFDGTSCLVRDGKLFKRYDAKHGKTPPAGWEACEPNPDPHTGHWPGWLPVGEGPDDRWHRETYAGLTLAGGTYELVGPKIQGNPYRLTGHCFWSHGMTTFPELLLAEDPQVAFEEIRSFLLARSSVEGLVWHHPDGRMVKIKRRDFGMKWPAESP